MKDWIWGLLLFVLLVLVLINPFKRNLRERYGGYGHGHGGYGHGHAGRGTGYGYYGGWGGSGASALNSYDEDYYYVLPKHFPFPLGYY